MTKAQFIEKDQDWQNEATTYWFAIEINGQSCEYGIRESSCSISVIGEDGREVEDSRLANQIKATCIVTDAMRAE